MNSFIKRPGYHFVLAGGGARGFAHLGVYRALQEHGYQIESIAGTSMGSLVGLFIAAGRDADQIIEVFIEHQITSVVNPIISLQGFMDMKQVSKLIKQYIPVTNIEELKLPLTVCVTNIDTGKAEYHTKGSISDLVIASCSVPFLFKALLYKGQHYVDGGVCDNFPIRGEHGRPIIGSSINPYQKPKDYKMHTIGMKALDIMINRPIETDKKLCQIFFESPKLKQYSPFDFNKREAIIDIGYQHACDILHTLEK